MNKVSRAISISIFLICNAILIAKYSLRILPPGFSITAALLVPPLLFAACLYSARWFPNRFLMGALAAVLVGLPLAGVAVLHRIPMETILNDRYYMIQTFWDNLLLGEHPYIPHVKGVFHNIPSAFPFYFVLAYPAYLIHEIGVLPIAAFILFCIAILHASSRNIRIITNRGAMCAVLLLATSACFWYELVTRSTLIFNASFFMLFIIATRNLRYTVTSNWVIAGICSGLILSTRSVFSVILAGYYLFKVKSYGAEWRKISAELLLAGGVFLLTIAPVYLWHPADFIKYNPFSVQSTFLPMGIAVPIGIAILIAMWYAKSLNQLVFISSTGLFGLVAVSFIFWAPIYGWHNSLYKNAFDVSLFCIPSIFTILHIIMCEKENSLSRISVAEK